MKSPSAVALACFLAPVALLLGAADASAQGTIAIDDARRALARYDLAGSSSTEAVAALTRYVAHHDGSRPNVREADAIRWKAAADLLVLSAQRDDEALRASLAEALDEQSATLELAVLDGLALVPVTAAEDPAEDAERAVTLLRAEHTSRAVDWRRHRGLRRDALFVRHVRQVVERSADPVAALSTLSADPCARRGTCAAIFAPFDQVGRRSVATLVAVHRAASRFDAAGAADDPFVEAARAGIEADRAALAAFEVRPGVRVPEASRLPTPTQSTVAGRPSVVVIVAEHHLRYAWVPSVRFGDMGPQLVAEGSPMLPMMEPVALSDEGHRRPRAVPSLVRAFRALSMPADAAVAVGVEDDHTPSEELSRVLLSLRSAGVMSSALLARASDGSARTVPLHLATRRSEADEAAVRVRMRLGGFTYRPRRGPSQDIPRVPSGPAGELSFDYETLRTAVSASRQSPPAMTFMAGVRSSALISAAFAVTFDTQPLTLFPY